MFRHTVLNWKRYTSALVTIVMALVVLGACNPSPGAVGNGLDGACSVQIIGSDASNDTLEGSAANELLDGLGGNDILVGNAGNDCLRGGSGDDFLWGGGDLADSSEGGRLDNAQGSDTFIFEEGFGNDQIVL